MKKLTYLRIQTSRFFRAAFAALGLVGLSARAGDVTTNTAPVSPSPTQSTLFDYNQYVGWIPPSQEGASFTTKVNSVPASDPYAGLANGTLGQQQTTSAYQKSLLEGVNVRYENDVVTNPVLAPATPAAADSSALSRQQKLSLQLAPASQVSVTGNVHLAANPVDAYGNEAVTRGVGLETAAPLPLQAQFNLQYNTDEVTGDTYPGPSSQTQLWQAQLTQPLGQLPVKAIVVGSNTQTTSAGAASQSPALEQALEWKIQPQDSLKVGVREMQYVEMNDAEHSNTLYADFSHQMAPNLSWHSYADMFHMEGMDAASSADSPYLNPVDDKSFTFSTGPSIALEKDMTARVEFSNTWDKGDGGPSTEHRVSLSINGTF